ncbi:hypothetical protein I352_00242 [Cryptococcus deuterogattii MMRL2647]|nr:hypothetical protein I352_00242 [Cryptococcus deuterogattii MMRL2647]
MTLIPPGAHLSPVDLPPPPPSADPREPSPVSVSRRTGARTPQRARSPLSSRDASPTRVHQTNRSPSSEHTSPLLQPFPRSSGSAIASPPSAVPVQSTLGHHLSRPSSPSSIHSSGSAIFERDIEHPPMASLSLNPNPSHQSHPLNHRPSRLLHLPHGSNLDYTVPAVLDDAVEALTLGDATSRGFEGLEIEAPAPSGTDMARQSSSGLPSSGRKVTAGTPAVFSSPSRSSSPISIDSLTSSMTSPTQSPPILSQLSPPPSLTGLAAQNGVPASPTSPTVSKTQVTASVPRPTAPRRISTGPQLPGGWVSNESEKTQEESTSAAVPAPAAVSHPGPPSAVPPHMSPAKGKPPHHRLSFISYNDILLSVPTQVTTFSEITSGNVSPDHLPGTVSPTLSTRSPIVPPPLHGAPAAVIPTPSLTIGSREGPAAEPKLNGDAGVNSAKSALGLPEGEWEHSDGPAKGEWEREGLGKGLEQRLEDLAHTGA